MDRTEYNLVFLIPVLRGEYPSSGSPPSLLCGPLVGMLPVIHRPMAELNDTFIDRIQQLLSDAFTEINEQRGVKRNLHRKCRIPNLFLENN